MKSFSYIFIAFMCIITFGGYLWWGMGLGQQSFDTLPILKRPDGQARSLLGDDRQQENIMSGLSLGNLQDFGVAEKPPAVIKVFPKPLSFQPEDIAGIMTTKTPEEYSNKSVTYIREYDDLLDTALLSPPVLNDLEKGAPKKDMVKIPPVDLDNIITTAPLNRPPRRPKNLEMMPLALSKNKEQKTRSTPIKEELSVAQFGTFPSYGSAMGQWAVLKLQHNDLLANKKQVIEEINKQGKISYRLGIGDFNDYSEMLDFCIAMNARGQECLPIRTP